MVYVSLPSKGSRTNPPARYRFPHREIPETVSLFLSRVRTVDREVTAQRMSREISGASRFYFDTATPESTCSV